MGCILVFTLHIFNNHFVVNIIISVKQKGLSRGKTLLVYLLFNISYFSSVH